MTSRERIVAALRREEPDRVPLDLGALDASGIGAIAYRRLREHLGLPPGRTRVFDPYQQVARIDEDLREFLGLDAVGLFLEPAAWKPGTLVDGSPCEVPATWHTEPGPDGCLVARDDAGREIARLPAEGHYFESIDTPPLAGAEKPADLDAFADVIESYDWPVYADETMDSFAARAKRLHDETDCAVVANLLFHFMAAGRSLRGFASFMLDLAANKPLAQALLERLLDTYIRRSEAFLDRAGDCVEAIVVNEDLGTQTGPMISPDCYRELIWPCQKRLFEFIKSRSDVAIIQHSCGSVARFIPLLIEAGADALNPVQVSAAEMDTRTLKREYGRDIAFWGGGCDTQYVLPRGTPGEVRAEVRRRFADLAPGGGFVFNQVHNIQNDTPPENIAAMFDAFRECVDGES